MRKGLLIGIAGLVAGAVLLLGASAAFAAGPDGAAQPKAGLGLAGKVAIVRFVSKEIGIRPIRLIWEVRHGKSVSQVAQEHGIAPATISQDLLAKIKARLDKAVTNGRITQEQENQALAKAESRINEALNRTRPLNPQGAPKTAAAGGGSTSTTSA